MAPVTTGNQVRSWLKPGEAKVDRVRYLVETGLDAHEQANPGTVMLWTESRWEELHGGAKWEAWKAKRG